MSHPWKWWLCMSSKSKQKTQKKQSSKLSGEIRNMASSREGCYEQDSQSRKCPESARRVDENEMTNVYDFQGHQNQYKKSEMYLPSDIIPFCTKKLDGIIKRLNKTAVDFAVVRKDEKQVAIQGTNKESYAEIEKALKGILAALYQKQIQTDAQFGLYLQSPEGKAWLRGLQQGSDLCVQVIWPELLMVRRQRHQLLVYGGYITAADSQVVVLPVFEESQSSPDDHHKYKDWTPECKHVLEAALMSPSLASYADILNQQPPFSVMLKSPGSSPSRHIALLHVPDPSTGKFKDHLSTAVKKAMHDAVDQHPDEQNLCIALPLLLETGKKGWKIILTAVGEALGEIQGDTEVTLKLYTGPEASETLVEDMQKSLMTLGWTNPRRDLKGSRVHVMKGDILEESILKLTEVMVNSTDPELKHTNGCVSKALLEKAGKNLGKECRRNYPAGLTDDCIVAVTDSHGLHPVEKIFHVALPLNGWTEKKEERGHLLEELRVRVTSCLTLASADGFGKITFPALGTGKLQYPAEEVAQAMISASQDFFDSMPYSSVETVCIVCHSKEETLAQTFKEMEKKIGSAEKGSSSKMAAFSTIHLCGSKTAVKQAAEKIQQKMQSSEEDPDGFLHVSAEDASKGAELEKQGAGRERERLTDAGLSCRGEEGNTKDLNLWSLSVPLPAYNNTNFKAKLADIGLMLKKLETESEPTPGKRLWFEQDQFRPVVNFIHRELLQSGNDTSQAAQETRHAAQETRHAAQETSYFAQETRHAAQETSYFAQETSHHAQRRAKQNWTEVLDECEVLALKSLIGSEFSEMFSENDYPGDKREIEFRGPSPPKMMLDKIESLRNEELPLSREECLKLGSPSNTRSEGVEAFIYPKPDERKVIIFSLEYSALTKAKHIINVRIGKVKVTSRGNRKFESDHREGARIQAPQPPVSSGHVSANAAAGLGAVRSDYVTKSGLKVSVYKTDITKLPVDAIVNAANENLMHGGGVAFAIARAAGFELEDECRQYIRNHGSLNVTQVAVTTGGHLPCKTVLHAVGPRWGDYKDKKACLRDLSDTIFNCLKAAHEHGLKTLAVSSISSAIFGVPQDFCAECYLRAVQQFDDQFGGTTGLAQVHFVDVSDTMVNTIQETFTQKWDSCMTFPSTQPVYDSSAHERLTMKAPETQRGVPFSRSCSAPVNVPEATGRMSEEPFHVHIKGVDVFFLQQQISMMQTDSIVLWQEEDKLFEHHDSQLVISREGTRFHREIVPELKRKLQQRSPVLHWQNPQLLICQKILTGAVDFCDLLCILNRANGEQVSSVAIPIFLKVSGSNKAAQGFGESLEKALSEYLKQPQRCVKEIHVVGSDIRDVKAAGEAFEHREHAILEDAKRPSESQRATRSVTQQQQQQQQQENRVCGLCRRVCEDPWTLTKCQHVFCRECVEQQFSTGGSRACPTCQTSYGYTASQPRNGEMKMKRESARLPGFLQSDTLVMEYNFPKRKQRVGDPEPGRTWEGLQGSAYLPNSGVGRKVLMLLKKAFDMGLLFRVGYESVSSRYVIGYSDIPLKTSKKDDSKARFAYPDPDYLSFVQGKLLEYGVSAKDFTPEQRSFVHDPSDCFRRFGRRSSDFSGYFTDKATTV